MRVPIDGFTTPGFEDVADAFRASFESERMGAAVCVYLHGKCVIDLWGGMADARNEVPWSAYTVGVIFSCTKGLMSILAAQLVEEGLLDYDAPVARYWPEFAAAGKADVRVRHLLNHQAGLSAPRLDLTTDDILDWNRVVGVLAAQAPLWPLGQGYAYHAITHGWLVGEVLRRASGRAISELFADKIADPLRASAWIGLPDHARGRVSHMVVGPTLAEQTQAGAATPSDWLRRAMTLGGALPATLVEADAGFNDPRLWGAEIPGAGGIASAHALARIWSATVWQTGGVRLLRPDMVGRATQEETSGAPVFDVPPPWPRWGMGFQLDSDARRYLTPTGFGHDGAGGQVAFAEPELGLGFAYVTNLMEGAGDTRATSVVDAIRAAPPIAPFVANYAATG